MPKDERVVYGANCSWWDSIDQADTKPSGLPCCPCCGGVLFEQPSEAGWWAQVATFEANSHDGYRDFIEWLRGRCFPGRAGAGVRAALAAYPGTVEGMA